MVRDHIAADYRKGINMSELQTADLTDEMDMDSVAEVDQTGTADSGSDLATDSGVDREEKDQSAVEQEKVQAAINRQHAKYREEERRRKEVEAKLHELEQRVQGYEASKPEPSIPPIPDPYDDDYDQKIRERDAAILAKAKYDAESEYKTKAQEELENTRRTAEQERLQSQITSYQKRVTEIGLNPDSMEAATQKVIDYGVSQSIAQFILEDVDGPLFTAYLAENPIELSELNEMSPMQAAIKMHTDIRAKSSGLKPQRSKAPPPADTLQGNGAGDIKSPYLSGAKFE